MLICLIDLVLFAVPMIFPLLIIYIGRDCKETSLVGGSRLLLLLLVLLERFDTFGHDA